MNESLAIETRELTKVYGSGNTEVIAMRDASVDMIYEMEDGAITKSGNSQETGSALSATSKAGKHA